MRRLMALLLAVCLMAMFGCSKKVPDKPNSGSSQAEPVSVLATLETKQAVLERVGEFTYPIDYTMTGNPGEYKLRDSIYYSIHLINQVSPVAKDLEGFAEYVGSIARVSLREYTKVLSEEMTLDGHTAWYVEGHGKDSNKYKYAVFMGINTENGMSVLSAVVNEEDWATKGAICKEIMMSFRHKGMIDPESLKTVLVSKSLKPSLTIPEGWRLVSDTTNTKVYKNPSNSVEFTIYFGKQDNASLERIMEQNGIAWETKAVRIEDLVCTEATGKFVPPAAGEVEEKPESKPEEEPKEKPESEPEEESEGEPEEEEVTIQIGDPRYGVIPGTLEFYALEATKSGYRCIIATVVKSDRATAEELDELQGVLDSVSLYEKDPEVLEAERLEREAAEAAKKKAEEERRKREEAEASEETKGEEAEASEETEGEEAEPEGESLESGDSTEQSENNNFVLK